MEITLFFKFSNNTKYFNVFSKTLLIQEYYDYYETY